MKDSNQERLKQGAHTSALVQGFHKTFEAPIAPVPVAMPVGRRKLRMKLLLEEVTELADAWGLRIDVMHGFNPNNDRVLVEDTGAPIDEVAAADAIADIDYINGGNYVESGLPAVEIINEVHASNMSKVGEDGKPVFRADGKIMKGPNFFEPRLAEIIERAKNP